MRVVLDQDGILAKWHERVLEWWNEDNGTSLTKADVHEWDLEKVLPPAGKYFVRSCCRYPELYRDLEPVDGAIEGVKELLARGHDVLIATALPMFATVGFTGKVEWLRRVMPFFPLRNLIVTGRKDLIQGDLLFDDGAHNAEAWARTGRPVLILKEGWNVGRFPDEHPLVTYVDSWPEFLKRVSEMERR